MRVPSAISAASEYTIRYGVYAKREIVRNMLDAASKGNDKLRDYLRSVLDVLINTEANSPPDFDFVMETSESVSDILVKELTSIYEQFKSNDDAQTRYCAELCGTSATYIQVLEDALVTMVREGAVGRPSALRVLRDGPAIWRRPVGGEPS